MPAYTATTDWKLPRAVRQDDSVGDTAWTDPEGILVDDSVEAGFGDNSALSHYAGEDDAIIIRETKLVVDGSILSTNKAGDQNVSAGDQVYGGLADDWSEALTGADVNNALFGVATAWGTNPDIGATVTKTNYLIGEDFGFEIPDSAVIDGIEVEEDVELVFAGPGVIQGGYDALQVRMAFSWDVEADSEGVAGGSCFVADTGQQSIQKRVRYLVSDPDGNFVGEWNDVLSELGFKTEINNFLSQLDVTLGRTEITKSVITDLLLGEDNDPILTESGDPILMDVVAALGLGEGTDLDLNHNLEVYIYFGQYEALLAEDGTPILTEDDKQIIVENGYPHGLRIFDGYVADWEMDAGQSDNISVQVLNHGNELNNIMLETEDSEVIENVGFDSGWIGVGMNGLNRLAIAQSFTMPSTARVPRLTVYGITPTGIPEDQCTALLILGAPTTDNVIANGECRFNDDGSVDVILDSVIELTNALVYSVVISPSKGYGTSLFNSLELRTTTSYAGGSAYVFVDGTGWVIQSSDIAFKVWEEGGDTTVAFLSVSPSTIVRKAIDFARTRGARVFYDEGSIDETETVVSITFKANTVKEVLEKCIELAPDFWFATYNMGTNLFTFKGRPSEPDRYFTKQMDIVKMKLRSSIKRLVNDVYFSGGGEPALFTRVTDTVSIQNRKRRGILKLSDRRVTDDDTARILSESEIAQKSEPEYIGSATISSEHPTPIEEIANGDVSGYMNFGNFIDEIQLQIASVNYNIDTVDVELGAIIPPVTKRVQDIKRNLETIEQQNNPTSPT